MDLTGWHKLVVFWLTDLCGELALVADQLIGESLGELTRL